MQSRIFLRSKEKIGDVIGDFGKSVGLSGEAISFLPSVLTLLGVYMSTGIK